MPSVSILSYLHYLHDVNRKLIQRGGMENVLYRKPVSQHPYYHQLDQPDSTRPRHWLGALRHIQNAEARGLALRPLIGLGLVVGQGETSKGAKRFSAPLAFCNAELIGKSSGGHPPERHGYAGQSDMGAQPDYSWLDKLSPPCRGDTDVQEDGKGNLVVSLAMGQTSALRSVGSMDCAAILASVSRESQRIRGLHRQDEGERKT